jgi:NADPH-dependent 2,4-dienoyl-CoA reductase/sulfur reductase-like enzyme
MLRRDFLKYTAIASALFSVPHIHAKSHKNSKEIRTTVAVCGAGFAGLSAAKELKNLNPLLDVLVIEQRPNFMSCPFSNAWLGEVQNVGFEDLNYEYNQAINAFGYDFLHATIVDIDRKNQKIITNKQTVHYDYLILATGIEYNYKKLFKRNKQKAKECLHKAPPGLKPGSEYLALKRMITHFKGGNFVISIPSQTYKCPPAPYERACMIAHYFKTHNIDGKVVIIDPRTKPAAKPESFEKAFRTYYPDTILYLKHTNFKDIDFKRKKIKVEQFNKESLDYEMKEIAFEEASVIPPNTSSALVKKSGLATYAQGWAKLQQPTFRSVSDDKVYIIGDAQGEYPYPKSAQMANSCGYLVAAELILRLQNKVFDYKNHLPGNVCYSMITEEKAVSISHLYQFTQKVHATTITSDIDKHTADAAVGWYYGLIEDILHIKAKI